MHDFLHNNVLNVDLVLVVKILGSELNLARAIGSAHRRGLISTDANRKGGAGEKERKKDDRGRVRSYLVESNSGVLITLRLVSHLLVLSLGLGLSHAGIGD